MKAYTDLEQSKKLTEILPIESADMWLNFYSITTDDTTPRIIHLDTPWAGNFNWDNKPDNIPCWSLAALFDVIPKEVKIKEQRYAPCLFPIIDGHWLYKLWYNSNEIIESPIAVWCDNPVDACYEMILKLHKQKLL